MLLNVTKTKLYNVDYFLNKFDSIPDDSWITGQHIGADKGQFCALGHCGERLGNIFSHVESNSLRRLFEIHLDAPVALVNDGTPEFADLGATPKERIMSALFLIKAGVSVK